MFTIAGTDVKVCFLTKALMHYNSYLVEQILKTSAPIAAAIAVILLAVPAIVSAIRQRGIAKGAAVLGALGLFYLAVEALAVKTGVLYGQFSYSDALGYRVLGTAPWLIAFALPPLVLAAFWAASKITDSEWRILLSAIFIMPFYLAIAPALSRMGIWNWEALSVFYDTPLQPFIAWFISGVASSFILHLLWGKETIRRGIAVSGFLIIWFWAGVNLGLEQYIPGVIGVIAGLLLVCCMWREKRTEKNERRKS